MKEPEIETLASEIFKAVEDDLRDRRGIRHEWDHVDPETQEEIRDTNRKNICRILSRALK